MNPAIHQAHIQQALRSNGIFVELTAEDFQNLMNRSEGLVVVQATAGIFTKKLIYLTSYKGLAFYCKTRNELVVPSKHERIFAKSVSLPIT